MSNLHLYPMFYGIQDHTVTTSSNPFSVRIYFPTNDDVIAGAPSLRGPFPLIIFAHGQRDRLTQPSLCPEEYTRDHQRWTVVLGGIARSGFVVAAPSLSDLWGSNSTDRTAERIQITISWMREVWGGRRTIHGLKVFQPGVTSEALFERGKAADQTSEMDMSDVSARSSLSPHFVGNPTPLALVGHSWGTRGVCAFAARNSGVSSLVTIAGTFDDNESASNLRAAQMPTLMICGTADAQNFAPMRSLWNDLPAPKYQTAFQGSDHWDWFGRFGAIRRCDGTLPNSRDTGHITAELIAGFFARHVVRIGFLPPDLVHIPLIRRTGIPWYDYRNAMKMRWDAPGENFDPLPSTGEGLLGPWTESHPW